MTKRQLAKTFQTVPFAIVFYLALTGTIWCLSSNPFYSGMPIWQVSAFFMFYLLCCFGMIVSAFKLVHVWVKP